MSSIFLTGLALLYCVASSTFSNTERATELTVQVLPMQAREYREDSRSTQAVYQELAISVQPLSIVPSRGDSKSPPIRSFRYCRVLYLL